MSGCTRTLRRLAPHYPDHLGCLVVPGAGNRLDALPSLPLAADNGCFRALDAPRFLRMVDQVAARPLLWLAVPDRAADPVMTRQLWDEWAPRLRGLPLAFVAQDGVTRFGIPWDELTCLFLGGTTAWKLGPDAAELAAVARRRGKLLHIGRVNSCRRLSQAIARGADSVDGTSASRFGDVKIEYYLRHMQRTEQQARLLPLAVGGDGR